MDVLHVLHQFPPETCGGSESYARDVVQRLRARGCDAQVLTGTMQWRPEVALERYEVDGIPVHRLHRDDLYFDHHVKAWHPGVSARFEQLLDEQQPKVVHVHHWIRLTSDLIAIAHARAIPCIVTIHDFYTSCPRAFRARRDDPACRRPVAGGNCRDCVPRYGHEPPSELEEGVELFAAGFRCEIALAHDVLVAVPSVADLLAATTGMPRDRYRVLPLGYRARFPGQERLPERRTGEPFRFAFWGGVGRHKGVANLVAAFAQVQQAGVEAELHVLGGFETPQFEQEVRAAAHGLRVHLHGAFASAQIRAVAPHCGVFPSTCIETFGIVLDECFELGLPCIVSDLGALPVRAAGAGLPVPAGDVGALAAAMRRLAAEPELWRQLRSRIPPPPPDLGAHVAALELVYAEALQRPAPVPCAPPVPLLRRLRFLQVQRDSALSRLIPPGGPA